MEIYPETWSDGSPIRPFGYFNLPIALAETSFLHGTFRDILGHLPTFGQFF
jgi:hypothetical protein